MDYTTLASETTVQRAVLNLSSCGITVEQAAGKAEVLKRLLELIPSGAEVMTGASTTLDEIGFTELLKSGRHPWRNLKGEMLLETDPVRKEGLSRRSVTADYFLGSVHALSETGEVVIASATGSQLPSYAYSSRNVIWVAGIQKITPTLADALRRVREYVLPCEDRRMKTAGYAGSFIGKILLFEREWPQSGRRITLLLVNERLGF